MVEAMQVEEHFDFLLYAVFNICNFFHAHPDANAMTDLLCADRIMTRITYFFAARPIVPALLYTSMFTEAQRRDFYMETIIHIASVDGAHADFTNKYGTVAFVEKIFATPYDVETHFPVIKLTAMLSMSNSISTRFAVTGLVDKLVAEYLHPQFGPEACNCVLIVIHNAADSPVGSSMLSKYAKYLLDYLNQDDCETSSYLVTGFLSNLCAHLPRDKALTLRQHGVVEHFKAVLASHDEDSGYISSCIGLIVLAANQVLESSSTLDPTALQAIFNDYFLNDNEILEKMLECFDAALRRELFSDTLFDPWLPAQLIGCLILNPRFVERIVASSAFNNLLMCCSQGDSRAQ